MKYKKGFGSHVFDIFNHSFMVILMLTMIYPFWYILCVSVSNYEDVALGRIKLFPRGIHFSAYKLLLSANDIPLAFKNSVVYTVVGTFIVLFISTMTAYVLEQQYLPYRKFVIVLFTMTMFIPGGMIPSFLLIKNLGMYNTMWAIVLPGAFGVWNILIIRSNIRASVPKELIDSAYIDGASDWRIYFTIVLPLIKPILATIGLFVAVDRWNDFFGPLIYLNDSNKYPLQIILRKILITGETAKYWEKAAGPLAQSRQGIGFFETLKMATIIITIWPILLVYPFIQKYFVKGVLVGSLKG
ncbi:MAG: carbohydrate ABC transporter permease [Clostridiaceae bacterium]|nr:carbohydrate ABC transporter permease [Clostridiaceae bacterium]